MNIYKPYTYLIGWSLHNKWYYGVRYGKNCHPGDLWKTYFTSSQYVKEFRENYGEPDVIQIRKTFDIPNEALRWEQKVLRRIKILKSTKWLNITHSPYNFINPITNGSKGMKWYNNGTSSILRFKCPSGYVSGRILDVSGEKNGNFGNKHNIMTKNIIAEKRIGYKWYYNSLDNIEMQTKDIPDLSIWKKGRRPVSKETREKISIKRKNRETKQVR